MAKKKRARYEAEARRQNLDATTRTCPPSTTAPPGRDVVYPKSSRSTGGKIRIVINNSNDVQIKSTNLYYVAQSCCDVWATKLKWSNVYCLVQGCSDVWFTKCCSDVWFIKLEWNGPSWASGERKGGGDRPEESPTPNFKAVCVWLSQTGANARKAPPTIKAPRTPPLGATTPH